ncbi:MAG: D-alanyl-D-alanine carboxypeptidase/D-alanyl-D-alanine-endopeptidase [Bacteroidales bacterium]|nr:D-alanyl-D-alanine carboxypeptidase/D-alanyl-D-alanine-endopeptidase [Bacteroidales bacterium]
MKKLIVIIAILAAALQTSAAQNKLQGRIAWAVRHSLALDGAAVGIAVKDIQSGAMMAEYNASTRLAPASNMKLITTGSALHRLGPGFTYSTSLGYTGTITDGILSGDLYIVGGGDPTTAGSDSISTPMAELFDRWKQLLEGAGIKRIDGRIIGDGRAWDGYLESSNWTWDDIGTYYGTGADALCFYQNAIDLQVAPGESEGEPVQALQTFPETPWMTFTNRGVTGREGTGNSLYLFTTDLAPFAQLRGSFALGRNPKTEHFANKFGALTCAYYFANHLRASGITVTGKAAHIERGGIIRTDDFVPAGDAGDPEIIGSSSSPDIGRIARETNLRSDNFYAEALYRTLGKALTGSAVYDSCRVAEKAVLASLGLSSDAIIIDDGSGLSRKNAVSARFLADFLAAMTSSPAFPAFLGSLPAPGEGTISPLLNGKACAARYRLKSGSMDGILCYSGYIIDSGGTPIATVSILVNGTTAPTSRVRKALESVLSIVAEEIPGGSGNDKGRTGNDK